MSTSSSSSTTTKIMEETLRVGIGIRNDEDEVGLMILQGEEQHQSQKNEPSKSKHLLSGLWWRQQWPSLKPFVNGGVIGFLGGSWKCLTYSKTRMFAHCRDSPQLHPLTKVVPGMIYIQAFTMSQQLGLHEILRKKAIATNEGMPPTLFQEAACGLTVGAVGACISFPLRYGYTLKQFNGIIPLPTEQPRSTSNYADLFRTVYSDLADKAARRRSVMVRIASPFVKTGVLVDMGMYASYNPGLHYLRESCGFSETKAQLGASAISAFFAAACGLPANHIGLVHEQSGYASTSLECALKILKSRGPLGFFAGFSRYFLSGAPLIMTMWFVLERIRKLELSIGL